MYFNDFIDATSNDFIFIMLLFYEFVNWRVYNFQLKIC